jgi:arginyl-tRNA synthetase
MLRVILEQAINKSLEKNSFGAKEVIFDHPKDIRHGDYSTNIALVLAKEQKQKPKEVAEKIVQKIHLPKEVERVEIAEAGFINFFVSKELLLYSLESAQKSDFGKTNLLSGKKIIFEYTDPNPFKVFHIGHLMTNTIGESISRIAEFNGADLKRVNYQGDVGLHIAKAVWGILNMGEDIRTEDDLGRAYSYGAKKFEENTDVQLEIVSINKKIYEGSDEKINEIYKKGRQISLDAFEEIYKKLGTKFDKLFFESEVGGYGKKLVEDNLDIFEKSEGATVFKGEKYGLHTRVFINSDGLPTYEAKELGLAKVKYDYFSYDESYIVTGNEINDYFKVLLEAMSLVYKKEGLAEKTTHIGHGMLRLPDGKMSSRTGDVVSAESLLHKVKEKVLDVMADREIENKEEIAEEVSVSAFKYGVLKQSIGKDVVFDFDKAVSFEGDSGPYLQYTTVRANSVLNIAEAKGIGYTNISQSFSGYSLERMIYRFPEIVERAWLEKSPQLVSKFLIDFAGEFNSFYANEKIAEKGGEYKVFLTKAILNVLKNGLYLLGIRTPERM